MKKISTAKIEEAVKRLATTYEPLTIYLFGSYAWGEPHEESDLDFMLVVPENVEHTFDLRRRGNRALAGAIVATRRRRRISERRKPAAGAYARASHTRYRSPAWPCPWDAVTV